MKTLFSSILTLLLMVTVAKADSLCCLSYPLLAPNGSVSAPTHSFASETNTGMFRNGSGTLEFSILGTNKLDFAVTTGSTWTFSSPVAANSLNVTSATAPSNGPYLPAAGTLGLTGSSKLEFLTGGSTNQMDYNVTTATTWTLAAATTINNATFKVTTLNASTAIDTVCYTTATGLFTEEPTGTTCTVSDERKKVGIKPISGKHSLEIVLGSSPISYYYLPEMQDPDYHLGFGAQTLAKVAPELVRRDDDGVPNAVKQLELLPITWAAMQEEHDEIIAMKADVAKLRAELGLR